MGAHPLSVSLTTIELFAQGRGTRLIHTEQGAYFGEGETVHGREEGTRELLEKLAEELDRSGVSTMPSI